MTHSALAPIAFSMPWMTEADAAAVAEVVRSGRLSIGPKLEAFEEALAECCGTRHAVGVSSGTAGLHTILAALEIGPGDEVLVPSFTFNASVSVIFLAGATPVFVDIEPDTYNLDPQDVEAKISPRTRAILAVDVFGHPAEWDELERIAARHGLALIDDCCEALGARYRGRPLGSLGVAGCFGFYPNKPITTGEGGMITTDDDELARRARSIRNQGRSAMGQWLEHEALGYNYRMCEMAAALGASQLARLEELLAHRCRVAEGYRERLEGHAGIKRPASRAHVERCWFVYVVELSDGTDRTVVMERLNHRGIPTRAYFSPIHLQPYVQARLECHPRLAATGRAGALPRTEEIAARTVALPFHPQLEPAELDRVVDALLTAVAHER